MFNLRALRYMTPFLMRDIDEIHEVFNGDPSPYRIEPNRPTLEAFMTYLTDQSPDRRPGAGRRPVRPHLRLIFMWASMLLPFVPAEAGTRHWQISS